MGIKVGYVKSSAQNKINKNYMDVRIESTEGREDVLDKENLGLVENDIIVYTTKEKEDDLILTVLSSVTEIIKDHFTYVTKASGTKVIIDDETINYGTRANQDKYEDYILVLADVDYDGNVECISKEKFADISFSDFDSSTKIVFLFCSFKLIASFSLIIGGFLSINFLLSSLSRFIFPFLLKNDSAKAFCLSII